MRSATKEEFVLFQELPTMTLDMVARQAEKDAEEYLSSPTSATLQQILGYRPGQFLGR